jgi:hypothetical protein
MTEVKFNYALKNFILLGNVSITSSLRFSHLPQGLSSNISLSSSDSSPLSLGDLFSVSVVLERLPGIAIEVLLIAPYLFQGSASGIDSICKIVFYVFQ